MSKHLKTESDRGFTLVELLIVLVIVGVIAALGVPNLISLFRSNQVKSALHTLVGAIKETQKQAMRQGKLCRINIDPSTNNLTATPNSCLLGNRTINDNITIRTNLSGSTPNIAFSHKGSTTKMGTIVLSSDITDNQQCFVISLGLGIIRTGNYTGAKTGGISAGNCQS